MKAIQKNHLIALIAVTQFFTYVYSGPFEEPKDHHFFVGIELKVPYNDEFYSIVGLENNQALLKVKDETVMIPFGKLENFRFKKETKISPHMIFIEDIVCEPEYSIDADPNLKSAQTNMLLGDLASQSNSRVIANLKTKLDMAGAIDRSSGMARAGYQAMDIQISADLASEMVQSHMHQGSIVNGELENGGKDVLRVSFKTRATHDIKNPYLIMIFDIKDTKKGKVVGTWFHFRSLDDITTNEDYVNFVVPSYPDGKFIDSFQAFFFDDSNEIASSLSSKRVDMTKEQARTFINYQYVAKNPKKTLTPTPVWKTIDSSLRKSMDQSLLESLLTITIDENGMVTGIVNEDQKGKLVSPMLAQSIENMFFYPALLNGVPVEGQLQVRMKEFLL